MIMPKQLRSSEIGTKKIGTKKIEFKASDLCQM